MLDRFDESQECARRIGRWAIRKGWRVDPDDLDQECRLAAWLACGSYDEARGVEFEKYCKHKVRFAALEYVRQQSRRRHLPMAAEDSEGQPEPADDRRSPLTDIDYADHVKALARFLEPHERDVFLLFHLPPAGLTTTEVGQILGWSQSGASKLHARALARVAAQIDSEDRPRVTAEPTRRRHRSGSQSRPTYRRGA